MTTSRSSASTFAAALLGQHRALASTSSTSDVESAGWWSSFWHAFIGRPLIASDDASSGVDLHGHAAAEPAAASAAPSRDVLPTESGWAVSKSAARAPRPRKAVVAASQAEAIKRAKELLREQGGGSIAVHAADGRVRQRIQVDARAAERSAKRAAKRAAMASMQAKKAAKAASTLQGKSAKNAASASQPKKTAGNKQPSRRQAH